jgi:hypothetical protein
LPVGRPCRHGRCRRRLPNCGGTVPRPRRLRWPSSRASIAGPAGPGARSSRRAASAQRKGGQGFVLYHLDPALVCFVQRGTGAEARPLPRTVSWCEGRLGQNSADRRVHEPGQATAECVGIRSERQQRLDYHPSLRLRGRQRGSSTTTAPGRKSPSGARVGIEHPLQADCAHPGLFEALDLAGHVKCGCVRPGVARMAWVRPMAASAPVRACRPTRSARSAASAAHQGKPSDLMLPR